jgi:hypothetical protein
VGKIEVYIHRPQSLEMPEPNITQLPPHVLNEREEAFVAKMTPKERRLHEIATKMLGSSYFVEWTHAFQKAKAQR